MKYFFCCAGSAGAIAYSDFPWNRKNDHAGLFFREGESKNNIFGLPFTEEEARVVILPVPWEVTVSYGSGTSRAAEKVFHASMQVDLFDQETDNAWKQGFYMRHSDKKILMKSDYLRKEAELFIHYISQGELLEKNNF